MKTILLAFLFLAPHHMATAQVPFQYQAALAQRFLDKEMAKQKEIGNIRAQIDGLTRRLLQISYQ